MNVNRDSFFAGWYLSGPLLLFLFLYVSTESQPVLAQEPDSLRTKKTDSLVSERPLSSVWVSRPPTGKSQKVQGGILMAAGGIVALAGVINLNRQDPCDDFGGPFVECLSNVEDVHTVGALQIGLGIGLTLFGLLRYNNGRKKAKTYEEWRRKNTAIRPRLRHSRHGLEVGLVYGF